MVKFCRTGDVRLYGSNGVSAGYTLEPLALADDAASLCAAFTMVVAIQARERFSVGQEVNVSHGKQIIS